MAAEYLSRGSLSSPVLESLLTYALDARGTEDTEPESLLDLEKGLHTVHLRPGQDRAQGIVRSWMRRDSGPGSCPLSGDDSRWGMGRGSRSFLDRSPGLRVRDPGPPPRLDPSTSDMVWGFSPWPLAFPRRLGPSCIAFGLLPWTRAPWPCQGILPVPALSRVARAALSWL
jgi:hypothetical protein